MRGMFMNKKFKIIVLVILFILLGIWNVDAKSSKTVSGIILKNNVSVMSSTSKSAKKMWTLKQGTIVNVRGISGNFYALEGINNRIGYVKKNSIALSYILVDISDQKLYVYKNGVKQWNANVVTGKKGVTDTPKGHYTLNKSNFKTNQTLMGGAKVRYWMPFITGRGIGFHDATWRSSFGGTHYINNGSHGCVNMSLRDAKVLYENAPRRIDVIVRQ